MDSSPESFWKAASVFITKALQVRLKAIQCISAMLSSKPASSGSPFLALREPSRAPMLGFSFSALLKAAEEEVQAGLTGSKALTAAALEATKHLIQGVDSGDALAFVLPGLASGLSKILIAAGAISLQLPPLGLLMSHTFTSHF